MSIREIFNIEENLQESKNETNKEELDMIAKDFKRGDFPNVLSKIREIREKHGPHEDLARTLSLIEAASHSQIGEIKQATDILKRVYHSSNEKSVDDLMVYGNVAFMCDYKLTRKIMSEAVKRIESKETFNRAKAVHAYLVLGEAEEKLEKFIRAIKYYRKVLAYLQEIEEEDRETVLFLHFKLGGLHSSINETEEAIDHLQKTIKLAEEGNIEVKINSLVSLARMYGSKNDSEKAITYLKEAIPLLEGSSLESKLVHAEAYTEMAYNYFDKSQADAAVPYYEKAVILHLKLPHYSPRELGMIYMQYAYCLEHKEQPDSLLAGKIYEKAIEQLEKSNDQELLENALADVIPFFERINNKKKKRFYENKVVKLVNERVHNH